jgi:hypothetical protein
MSWSAYGRHVVPLQQPLEHDAAVQVHCPLALSHDCIVAAHEPQALAAPHWVSDCCANGKQVVPLTQQPVVHELGVQTHPVPLHSSPGAHAWHGAPVDPHVSLLVVLHCWRLLQQPLHEVGSQTQSMPLQRCPCSQV